jgi:hypothetical protein
MRFLIRVLLSAQTGTSSSLCLITWIVPFPLATRRFLITVKAGDLIVFELWSKYSVGIVYYSQISVLYPYTLFHRMNVRYVGTQCNLFLGRAIAQAVSRPLDRRLSRPQSQSERYREEKKPLSYRELNPNSPVLQPVAMSVYWLSYPSIFIQQKNSISSLTFWRIVFIKCTTWFNDSCKFEIGF